MPLASTVRVSSFMERLEVRLVMLCLKGASAFHIHPPERHHWTWGKSMTGLVCFRAFGNIWFFLLERFYGLPMVEWNQLTASSNRQTRQRFGGEWMTENDGDMFQMSDWVHQLPSSMLHSSQQNVTFSQRHERKGNSFANGWIFQPNMLGHQKGVHCCDLKWCDVSQNCAGVTKIQHRWCGGSGLGTLESYNQNRSFLKSQKYFSFKISKMKHFPICISDF